MGIAQEMAGKESFREEQTGEARTGISNRCSRFQKSGSDGYLVENRL